MADSVNRAVKARARVWLEHWRDGKILIRENARLSGLCSRAGCRVCEGWQPLCHSWCPLSQGTLHPNTAPHPASHPVLGVRAGPRGALGACHLCQHLLSPSAPGCLSVSSVSCELCGILLPAPVVFLVPNVSICSGPNTASKCTVRAWCRSRKTTESQNGS